MDQLLRLEAAIQECQVLGFKETAKALTELLEVTAIAQFELKERAHFKGLECHEASEAR